MSEPRWEYERCVSLQNRESKIKKNKKNFRKIDFIKPLELYLFWSPHFQIKQTPRISLIQNAAQIMYHAP